MQKDSEYSATKGPYKGYPNDWKVIELGDLLNRVRRPVEVISDHRYQEIGIRSHGKGLFYKEPVKGRDLGNKSVFWVEADCLIINIVFAWEQAVGITTGQEKGMIASHRFPMWRSKGDVDLNYLLKILLTPLGRHLLELASPGGAGRNRTLGQADFNKTPVCIPSNIKEQQKIIKILSTWDRAIKLEERLISEKKQQKKWLMQNLLTGEKRLPGFTGEWQRKCLKDVCECLNNRRVPLNSEQRQKVKGFIPYYGANGIVDYIDNYIFNEPIILIAEDGGNFNEYQTKPIALRVQGKCWVNNHAHIISITNADFNFVFYSLVHKNVRLFINGSTRGKLNQEDMLNIPIYLPIDINEQTAIAEILSTADREIDLHEKQLEELKKQKKALMQLLLTGIVRVNAQEVS